jgi:ribonuclease J
MLEERVPAGRVSVEGTRLGDVDADTLRARRRLAYDGIVIVADVAGKLRVTAQGVASESTLPPIIADAEAAAEEARRTSLGNGARAPDIAEAVRRAVLRTFSQARGKKPRVIAML